MKRQLHIAGIVVGAGLMLGPLWGMLGTAFGMQRAFTTLGQSEIADPSAVSAIVGSMLISSIIGIVACPIGIILFVVCITQLDKARRAPPPLPPVER